MLKKKRKKRKTRGWKVWRAGPACQAADRPRQVRSHSSHNLVHWISRFSVVLFISVKDASLIFHQFSWNSDTDKSYRKWFRASTYLKQGSVLLCLEFIDKSTGVNVPFGGSRLFSVNTQTNKNDYNPAPRRVFKENEICERAGMQTQGEKKKKGVLFWREKARRLCTASCAEWNVTGRDDAKQSGLIAFLVAWSRFVM